MLVTHFYQQITGSTGCDAVNATTADQPSLIQNDKTTGVPGLRFNGSTDILATVFSMTPNQYHPLHAHPDLGELYFILEGACEVRVGDQTKWAEAQTAIYVPRGTPHQRSTENKDFMMILIKIYAEPLKKKP